MARRTLRNIDERILKRVIYYGAKNGVGDISTKKIAADLRITEPTIYVHFKTKENLLRAAYKLIMDDALESEKRTLEPLIGKRDQFEIAVSSIWMELLTMAQENKDMVIYTFEYSHSPVGDQRGNDIQEEKALMHKFFNSLAIPSDEKLPSMVEDKIISLAIATVELFCYKVAIGSEKATPITAKIMASLVIHGAKDVPSFLNSLTPEERQELDQMRADEDAKKAAK